MGAGETDRGVERDDADGVVIESDGEEAGPLLAGRDAPEAHADDVRRHLLPLRVLVQLARLWEGRQRKEGGERVGWGEGRQHRPRTGSGRQGIQLAHLQEGRQHKGRGKSEQNRLRTECQVREDGLSSWSFRDNRRQCDGVRNITGRVGWVEIGGITYRVHLKVDEFAPGQGDHHLALVDGAADDHLVSGRLPFVDALVGADVTDAVRVHLVADRHTAAHNALTTDTLPNCSYALGSSLDV